MSYLPPGVTVNMIPGNRPEDELCEQLYLRMAQAVEDIAKNICANVEDIVWALREVATDIERGEVVLEFLPHPLAQYNPPEEDENDEP